MKVSFGGQDDLYDRARPGYSNATLFDLIDHPRRSGRALDVGCGTGALTRVVASLGYSVTGVDPDERMVRKARSLGSAVLHGSAIDYLATDDRDVELVVCAQAWHWLSLADRLAVCRRVRMSGGRLLLVWNLPDASVDAATALLHRAYYLSLPSSAAETSYYIEANAPIDLGLFERQLHQFGLTQTAIASTANELTYHATAVVGYFKTISSSSLLSQAEWDTTERLLLQQFARSGESTLTFSLVTLLAQGAELV